MALNEFNFFKTLPTKEINGGHVLPYGEKLGLLKSYAGLKKEFKLAPEMEIGGERFYLAGTVKTSETQPKAVKELSDNTLQVTYISLRYTEGGGTDGFRRTAFYVHINEIKSLVYKKNIFKKVVKQYYQRDVKKRYQRLYEEAEQDIAKALEAFDSEVDKLVSRGADRLTSCPRLSALDSAVFDGRIFLKNAGLKGWEVDLKIKPLENLLKEANEAREAGKKEQEKERQDMFKDKNPIANNPFASLLG